MPSYVFGANELVADAKSLVTASNGILMSMILGMKPPKSLPGTIVHVKDVAKVHVGALNEEKVVGNKNFFVSIEIPEYEEALDITKRLFPDAVADGRLPLGGTRETTVVHLDTSEAGSTFGQLKGY
jgi:hypothetical protein